MERRFLGERLLGSGLERRFLSDGLLRRLERRLFDLERAFLRGNLEWGVHWRLECCRLGCRSERRLSYLKRRVLNRLEGLLRCFLPSGRRESRFLGSGCSRFLRCRDLERRVNLGCRLPFDRGR